MVNALKDFVDDTVGRPYASLTQIVKLGVEIGSGKEMTDTLNAEKEKFFSGEMFGSGQQIESYFCSQLIAVAYKKMGLLSPYFQTSSVLPGYFENEDMKLMRGRLGPVLSIPQNNTTT
eukprot:TRINITY_DN16328_c0_g1_i1.p1 TRINITY_DN16328_c0_g1~~TRINITY_DN16328_c0_g1_i1.p1  ORF type:complete len:134 (+),score=22.80 TRINITY_DN16328_c0_g1_i1:50-403(+)